MGDLPDGSTSRCESKGMIKDYKKIKAAQQGTATARA
jgi:hypothetical protein